MRFRFTAAKMAGAALVACAMNISMVSGAAAMPVVSQSNLSTGAALKLVRKAVHECKKDGFNVSAAVVDASGVLLAHLRHNSAGPHTVSSAFRKAFSSASLRRDTGGLAELIVNVPTTAGLQFMNDNLLLLQGGLPISVGGEVVGGIGVGGAPGGQLDEACAAKALQSLNDGGDD